MEWPLKFSEYRLYVMLDLCVEYFPELAKQVSLCDILGLWQSSIDEIKEEVSLIFDMNVLWLHQDTHHKSPFMSMNYVALNFAYNNYDDEIILHIVATSSKAEFIMIQYLWNNNEIYSKNVWMWLKAVVVSYLSISVNICLHGFLFHHCNKLKGLLNYLFLMARNIRLYL